MTTNTLRALALAAFGLTPASHAAVTAYSDDTAGVVSDVTVDGTTYDTGILINGTVTGFTDPNAVQLLVGEGGSVPASGSRAGLVSDLSLSTGILNIAGSFTFTFDAAVANGSGIDLLIWDWGGFKDDTFSITINGQTFDDLTNSDASMPPGADFYSGGARGSDWFGSDSSSGVSTVGEMEALSFTGSKNDTNAFSQGVIGLDLSAFNVTSGDTITSLTIDGGSGKVDPTLILAIPAIPEPSTSMLLGALVGLLLLHRRRA